MLHQVQQAIMLRLPMERTISHRNGIAKGLAAPWRRRRVQLDTVMDHRLQSPKAALRVAS